MKQRLRKLTFLAAISIVLYVIVGRFYSYSRSRPNMCRSSNINLTEPGYMDILNSTKVAQDDPLLVKIVRRWLVPPSHEPYNFENKNLADRTLDVDPSAGQSQAVKDILVGFGKDGFFIECGANDGEKLTNTLWVERNLGWQGLLIEADSRPYRKLCQKHRKAHFGNFCLSNKPHPMMVPFYTDENSAALGSGLTQSETYGAVNCVMTQCFPLYTVLLAAGRTTVDFFSLDVEGNEMEILSTIPFDKVIFKVITIEHSALNEGKMGLRKFMVEHGYIFYRTVVDPKFASGDSIFIHNSVALTKEQRAKIGIEDSNLIRAARNESP